MRGDTDRAADVGPKLQPGQPRHGLVRDHRIEAFRMGFESFQRGARVGMHGGAITVGVEDFAQQLAERHFIVHDQDVQAAGGRIRRRRRSPRRLRGMALGGVEKQAESRSTVFARARVGFHQRMGAVFPQDAHHHRQPHAAAAPDFLGGEEGVEDPGQHLGGDAAAIVLHVQFDELAAHRLLADVAIPVFEPGEAQADFDVALAFGGVAGVDHQVGEDLVQLHGIDADGMDVFAQAIAQLQAGGQGGGQHLDDFLDQRPRIQQLRLAAAASGEGQHLLNQVARALASLLDFIQVADGALRQVLAIAVQGEAGEAQDGAQDVVEVVGDAAGELADRLQFLRVL